MTFEEFKKEATEGRKLSVYMNGYYCEDAEIHIEDGDIYILQYVLRETDRKKYKHSYKVSSITFEANFLSNIQWKDSTVLYVEMNREQYLSIASDLEKNGYKWEQGQSPTILFGSKDMYCLSINLLTKTFTWGKELLYNYYKFITFEQFKKDYLNIPEYPEEFKIGDFVVCINNDNAIESLLVKGKVYTVKAIECGLIRINNYRWLPYRFRKATKQEIENYFKDTVLDKIDPPVIEKGEINQSVKITKDSFLTKLKEKLNMNSSMKIEKIELREFDEVALFAERHNIAEILGLRITEKNSEFYFTKSLFSAKFTPQSFKELLIKKVQGKKWGDIDGLSFWKVICYYDLISRIEFSNVNTEELFD